MMQPSTLCTDLYQLTMMQGYFDHQMNGVSVFEFFVRRLPPHRKYLVAAGLEQVIDYLENLRFSNEDIKYLQSTGFFHDEFLTNLRTLRFTGDVDAMAEGTVFFPDEPIIRITAPLQVAQLVETRIINILQFQTMVASKAARIRTVAGDKILLDFGLRRSHSGEAGNYAARASYLAGFNATATVQAGQEFDIPVSGTMAHSFILAHDFEMDAFRHFAHSQPNNVVLLIDTYDIKQGAFNVVKLASELKKTGGQIKGVRIDSGDLLQTSTMVREIFDENDLNEVKIFVSNSLDEYAIKDLNDSCAPIDGFGVGTRLTTSSDYPYLDCAYKLVEYEGKACRKRSASKSTLPGRKQIFRSYNEKGQIEKDTIGLYSEKRSEKKQIVPVMSRGQVLAPLPTLQELKSYTRQQIDSLPDPLLTLDNDGKLYPVDKSLEILQLISMLDSEQINNP